MCIRDRAYAARAGMLRESLVSSQRRAADSAAVRAGWGNGAVGPDVCVIRDSCPRSARTGGRRVVTSAVHHRMTLRRVRDAIEIAVLTGREGSIHLVVVPCPQRHTPCQAGDAAAGDDPALRPQRPPHPSEESPWPLSLLSLIHI